MSEELRFDALLNVILCDGDLFARRVAEDQQLPFLSVACTR
jgi:hypothetical protein